jgi:type 2 lantibiotic biosynthesis protein LanM
MNNFPSHFLERTASIEEILSDNFITANKDGFSHSSIPNFIERWKLLISQGDSTRFTKRLKLLNISEAEVVSKLSGFRSAYFEDPSWVSRAKELYFLLTSNKPPWVSKNTLRDYPFVELFSLPLSHYYDELVAHLVINNISPAEASYISQKAIFNLEKSWSKSISPIIYSLFNQYRQRNKGSNYSLFLNVMIEDGFHELFESRPVLLRILAVELEQWLINTKELLLRLFNDLVDISTLLELEQKLHLMNVASIDIGLSDYHNLGKSVCQITFSNNQKIIYKPKDLRCDVLIMTLTNFLHEKSAFIDLKLPKVLARKDYGWTSYIEQYDCLAIEQVKSHYFSSGAWLAIFYALNGSDMHEENIIASGQYPIPVDLEVIFQGGDSDIDASNAIQKARQKISTTVLGVGMLPSYGKDHLNNYYELGGLKEHTYEENIFIWTNLNSDTMELSVENHQYKNDKNVPTLNGVKQEITEYRDSFIDGFVKCINTICEISTTKEFNELISKFSSLEFRKVYRPTFFYVLVINRLKDFKTLNSGLEWSLHAEFFYRLISDWDKLGSRDQINIAKYENRASLSLNIPYFTINCKSKFANSLEGIPFLSDSVDGFELVRNKIDLITDKEIAWQVQLIDLSLNFQNQKKLNIAENFSLTNPLEIAEFIAAQAISEKGTAAWIGLEWHEEIDKFQLSVLSQDFYNGNGGIAFFLAASSLAYQKNNLLKLAYEAVSPLRQKLHHDPASILKSAPNIGIGVGLTSYIYSLTSIGLLTRDQELIKDAAIAANLIDKKLIESDKNYDIMGGSAGAILALLKLYQINNQSEILNSAIQAGNYLVDSIDIWLTSSNSPTLVSTNQISGFAHGAAGIALALFSLAERTNKLKFFEAAQFIVSIENNTFSKQTNNWPDVKFKHLPENQWACQWCHGASGIGLARIASLKHIRPSDIRAKVLQDVHNAVAGTLQRQLPGPLDSLCCGNLGNIVFLKEAGYLLKKNDLVALAHTHLSKIIDRSKLEGDYNWNSGTSALNFSLFRGLSGLGYEMLRSRQELKLPNVLIWE